MLLSSAGMGVVVGRKVDWDRGRKAGGQTGLGRVWGQPMAGRPYPNLTPPPKQAGLILAGSYVHMTLTYDIDQEHIL